MRNEGYMTFSELYKTDFEVVDLYAAKQKWKKGSVFHMSHPRKCTSILFLNQCHGRYKTKEGTIVDAPCKSLVCLPAGSIYSVTNAECSETLLDAYIVDFNVIKDEKILTFSNTPFLVKNVNGIIAGELVQKVVKAYEAPIQSPLAIRAAVYNLLDFLGKSAFRAYTKKFSPIMPGIEYLKENYLTELSIREVADMCNVSEGYFRKLFYQYAGKSPNSYRMDLRLGMAKNMLDGSDITVEDIAESLEFRDSSYFCKLFKKKVGMSPGEYRKRGEKKLEDRGEKYNE